MLPKRLPIIQRLRQGLFAQVDGAALAIFRLGFGLILFWDVLRYFGNGWIESHWITPRHHFGYWPLEFLQPLPGDGMYYLFAGLGISALCIAIGLFYRVSTVVFWLGFTYCFFLEQARYLNHFYLVVLIGFVLMWIPAHRAYAVDAWLWRRKRASTVPAWSVWWLRFTIALPYFFGGIAKLNADWLAGQPMRLWLLGKTEIPLIGPWMVSEDFLLAMAWAGMLLDLAIVPMLLWRRSRVIGFCLIAVFHVLNALMFEIGIFPWLMILATTLFFAPDWVRRWPWRRPAIQSMPAETVPPRRWLLVLMAAFVAVQLFLPLRHFFIPGNVHWTEEGHRYAWHMKLRSKRAHGTFIVQDVGTAQRDTIQPIAYLESWQVDAMLGKPYLIWQFARLLHVEAAANGRAVQVFADIQVSLNGRKHQPFIDPKVDLASVPRPLWPPTNWILPELIINN